MERLGAEKKEMPSYSITISVNRHGPRPDDDQAGLLPEHKSAVFNKTHEDYDDVPLDDGVKRKSIVSPKIRTGDTDLARQKAMAHFGAQFVKVETDERLSEGGMDHYADYPPDELENWFREYYAKEKSTPEAGSGQEVAASFASWVIDTIEEAQGEGGKQEVDATTHAPTMAAFIFKLEDKLGIGIISKGPNDEKRLGHKFLSEVAFPLMSSFNLHSSSQNPEIIKLHIKGLDFDIPLSIIRELAK